jgi:uncharacterized protein with PhoU and TrkA domain
MPQLEKMKYKPVPVRDLFLEMKNLSELMIDLAYSAALFNDRELAEEILALEDRVDTLDYLLEMTIMIAARDAHDAEALTSVSTAASAADKISDAAGDIAALVTQNIGVHPIVTQVFEKVEERLMQAKVAADSSLVGKRVGELDLAAQMGVDIIAVRREKDWIINPKKIEHVRGGDVLIVRGTYSGVKKLKELAEQRPSARAREAWTEVSQQSRVVFEEIVERLVELKDTSELMIDLAYSSLLLNNTELAEEVQRLEEHVDKLHTDFELLVLQSEFTKDEARGFLGLIRLGVATEKIADAAAQISQVVLRGIEPHPVLQLSIKKAEETVAYVPITRVSQLVGKTLVEAHIPEQTGMWILAIRRCDRSIRPKPDTRIEAGDILIASGYAEGLEDLRKMTTH